MAKLTYQARKKLPASDFVFPKTKSYPIEDEAHARAALQDVAGARSGKPSSASKQAKVRAAVHRRYPNIGRGRKSGVALKDLS